MILLLLYELVQPRTSRDVKVTNKHEQRLVYVRSSKLTKQMNEQERINERAFLFMFIRLTNYVANIRSFIFVNIVNEHK